MQRARKRGCGIWVFADAVAVSIRTCVVAVIVAQFAGIDGVAISITERNCGVPKISGVDSGIIGIDLCACVIAEFISVEDVFLSLKGIYALRIIEAGICNRLVELAFQLNAVVIIILYEVAGNAVVLGGTGNFYSV